VISGTPAGRSTSRMGRFGIGAGYRYVDTGFFVDDVAVGGQAATLSSEPGKWLLTTGIQVVSPH
jgi:hypothetical protein